MKENWLTRAMLIGMKNDIAPLERSLEVSKKPKCATAIWQNWTLFPDK